MESAEQLVACVRDLTSLLALPALWSGRDPETVGRTLFEALEAVLPVDVAYLQQESLPVVLRARQRPVPASEFPQWSPFLAACRAQSGAVQLLESPVGPVCVASLRMTYERSPTALWVGSRQEGFPTSMQRAFLVAAASLAATGLKTARLIAERELADRAKDEFLAMLAHELRNPLAPITTALDLMQLKAKTEVDYERDVIQRQVRHLTRLVDDLMDVARVARGKIELKRERVELARIVAEAVETAHPLVEQRRHVLQIDVAPSGLPVHGDPERLKQVVANLIGNAAKYTDPGGRIAVSARRAGPHARLEVRDNGMGIERDLLPRVFELFAQGRTASDRAAGGLGIGLALVKTLVQLHGGTVRAESEGAGRGSAFIVELPLEAAHPDVAAPAVAPASPAPLGARILVVDDNRDAAHSMSRLLKMLGHEVRLAHDADEAFKVLETFRPSLVLLDIGLPGMDGYELAAALRRRFGEETPRLVAVTGYGQAQDRARSEQAGIDQHLTKPVALEVLARILN